MKKSRQKKIIKLAAPIFVAGMMLTPNVLAASPKAPNVLATKTVATSKIPVAT